ncbi:hypothetical protein Tco_0972943 [Tanacetum coccineum]
MNPSSPPGSPKSFLNRKIREFHTLLESLDLATPSLEREPSCLEGDVGFVELFKEYKIGDVSEEEIKEDEVERVEELGKPFVEVSNMTYDPSLGIVKFTNRVDEVANQMPHKIDQFQSLSNMEKEHKKLVYFRNEEDKRRGVDYMTKKIFSFYKECIELGPK